MITFLCPAGAESYAQQELVALGARTTRLGRAQVHVEDEAGPDEGGIGGLKLALMGCLHARLVSRPLLQLAVFPAPDAKALYDGARTIHWPDFVDPRKTLSVRCARGEGSLRHGPYVAQVLKDAIVDALRDDCGMRPDVDRKEPDATIVVAIVRGQAHVSFDLAGESLHRRGIRLAGGTAPLSESLAALMLSRAGWPRIAAAGGAFADPMCGSGTLLIEAAGMARQLPANAMREHFGADGLACLPQPLWRTLRREARELYKERRAARAPAALFGSDIDPRQLRHAEETLEATGFADDVELIRAPAAALQLPAGGPPGLIATNAPYGERLEATRAKLLSMYDELGAALRRHDGYVVSVLCGDEELGYALQLRNVRKTTLLNGGLECILLQATIGARARPGKSAQAANGDAAHKADGAGAPEPRALQDVAADTHATSQRTMAPMAAPIAASAPTSKPQADAASPGAPTDFIHRLQKNRRRIEKRAMREGWGAYRIYDADIPNYAAAIDVYVDERGHRWAYLQEYKAPPEIPFSKAQARMRAMVLAAPEALDVAVERFVVVVRSRQREKDAELRYTAKATRPRFFTVQEAGMRFEVSLEAYIDTGLYLDDRALRALVRQRAQGKHFLNLFCYTSAVSVAAALGGALSTTSVDKSTTYLDWSTRNFSANRMADDGHRLVRADVMKWLQEAVDARHLRRFYDIAFIGPPSYSQSHSDPASFDVVEHHSLCIEQTMALLRLDGELYFSTHRRGFALDDSVLQAYRCEEMSQKLLGEDFKGSKPHRIWRIAHQANGE